MLRDLDALDTDPFAGAEYDVCIVGAGFAGIALALNLPRTMRVLLLEGGGLMYRQESQDVYKGRNVGHAYFDLDVTRVRQFGGTSWWWGGWTRPLETWDFAARDDVAHSGWPIRRADLDPYLARTRGILDIPETTNVQWGGRLDGLAGLDTFDFHWSTPLTQMGIKYRDEIAARDNVDCVVSANLVDLRLDESGARVGTLTVADYRGRRYAPRARRVVLAMGGIEIPRFLLNCDAQQPGGLGNGHDLVGRYFIEHPHFDVGHFLLEDALNAFLVARHRRGEPLVTEYLQPTHAFMRRSGSLNFGLRVIHWGHAHDDAFKARLRHGVCLSQGLTDLLARGLGHEPHCQMDGLVRIASEQAPNPDSRLSLYDERDRFGLRRVQLDWRLQAIDKFTQRAAMLQLAAQFAAHDIGRVRIADWLLDEAAPIPGLPNELGGNHHLGTTRMGDSPRTGVVDADLKMFGIDNVYVCSSSVFPTGGHANPTLTLVQLALRLADHLAAEA